MASKYKDVFLYFLLISILSILIYYIYYDRISLKHNKTKNNFEDTDNKMPDNILDYIDAAKNIGDIKSVNINTAYLTGDEQNAMQTCKSIMDNETEIKKVSNLSKLFPYNGDKYASSSNISCSSVYSDYLLNNMDFDENKLIVNNEGTNVYKSLSELCPVTVKTPEYINCLDTVENILKKTNAIVSDVSINIDNIVNENIDNSFNRIADLEEDLLISQMQKKYQDYMLYSGDITNNSNMSTDKILAKVNKYYSTKAIEGFSNMDDEIEKGIIVMDTEQEKYFGGDFLLTDSFNLLDNIVIEIKNNIIIFYNNDNDKPLFYFEYDNVKNVGVLNNNMSVSNISAGEIQAIKVRITKLVENNTGNSMENFEILKLLNNIGMTVPGFIYIVRTDISVVDGGKSKNKEYYLVKNSGYATMFQMFRINKVN